MSNYLSTVTIGDCVGPEFAACLGEIETSSNHYAEFLSEEQAAYTMNRDMQQTSVWDKLWRFGVVLDEDIDWYMPSDFDVDVQLVELEERDDRDSTTEV